MKEMKEVLKNKELKKETVKKIILKKTVSLLYIAASLSYIYLGYFFYQKELTNPSYLFNNYPYLLLQLVFALLSFIFLYLFTKFEKRLEKSFEDGSTGQILFYRFINTQKVAQISYFVAMHLLLFVTFYVRVVQLKTLIATNIILLLGRVFLFFTAYLLFQKVLKNDQHKNF